MSPTGTPTPRLNRWPSRPRPTPRRRARALPGHGESHRHVLVPSSSTSPAFSNRVASLMRARNFNIETLAVSHTDQPEVSRMTITLRGTTWRSSRRRSSSIGSIERAQGSGRQQATRRSSTRSAQSRSAPTNAIAARVLTIAEMYKSESWTWQPIAHRRGDRNRGRGGRSDRPPARVRIKGARPLRYRRHVPGCRVDREATKR